MALNLNPILFNVIQRNHDHIGGHASGPLDVKVMMWMYVVLFALFVLFMFIAIVRAIIRREWLGLDHLIFGNMITGIYNFFFLVISFAAAVVILGFYLATKFG